MTEWTLENPLWELLFDVVNPKPRTHHIVGVGLWYDNGVAKGNIVFADGDIVYQPLTLLGKTFMQNIMKVQDGNVKIIAIEPRQYHNMIEIHYTDGSSEESPYDFIYMTLGNILLFITLSSSNLLSSLRIVSGGYGFLLDKPSKKQKNLSQTDTRSTPISVEWFRWAWFRIKSVFSITRED